MRIPTLEAVLVLAGAAGALAANRCAGPYDGTACRNYVNYTYFLAGNDTVETMESRLAHLPALVRALGESDECVDQYYRWACGRFFPQCRLNVVFYSCRSTCEAAVSKCSVLLAGLGLESYIPDCAEEIPPFNKSYQRSQCIQLEPIVRGPTEASCPAPLVSRSSAPGSGSAAGRKLCVGGCCLPCPITRFFYTEAQAALAEKIVLFSGIGSFCLAALNLIASAIVVRKRQLPSTILCLAVAVTIFQSTYFFDYGTPSDRCAAGAETTRERILCALQGPYTVFGAFAVVMWLSFFIVSFHLINVWNSSAFVRYLRYANVFCWGTAVVMAGIVAATGDATSSRLLCEVSPKVSNTLFFYPMAGLIFPPLLVHAGTTVHILWRARARDASLEAQRRVFGSPTIDWRPLCLAFLLQLTFIFYWLFWFIQVSKMNSGTRANVATLRTWWTCLVRGSGQGAVSASRGSRFFSYR